MSAEQANGTGFRRSIRGSRDGSALVVAIFTMVILLALAAAATARVRLQARAARAGMADLQRLHLAMAGVRLAEATLRLDTDTAADWLEEEWALLGGPEGEEHELEPGTFRVQVIDTASRVDINRAPAEMLTRLPGIDEAMADAILDWREVGETPRPAGAKADYYQSLPEPYLPREAPLETIAELLLVRDITPALLYGPPQPNSLGEEPPNDLPLSELVTVLSREPNVSASGEARINLNTATADQLMEASVGVLTPDQAEAIITYRGQSGEFTSAAELLDVPGLGPDQVRELIDLVSTAATPREGCVNINTASEQVLGMVPGITPEVAAEIVATRESAEEPFDSLGDLLTPELLDEEAFREAAPYLCVRSSVFLVRAMGKVPESPSVTAIEALVERTDTETRLVRWARVERAPGWIAWGWPRQAAGEENNTP